MHAYDGFYLSLKIRKFGPYSVKQADLVPKNGFRFHIGDFFPFAYKHVFPVLEIEREIVVFFVSGCIKIIVVVFIKS